MSNKNTVITWDNIEIYENNIDLYADEYISTILHDDTSNIKDIFPNMIIYISKHIPKPDNDNIELLNDLFECYINLCTRFNINPTMGLFGTLVHIDPNTFSSWSNGAYRTNDSRYSIYTKRWKARCGEILSYKLAQGGASPNMIFTAKAVYGMVETAPVHQINIAQHEQIAINTARQQFADFQIEQKEE